MILININAYLSPSQIADVEAYTYAQDLTASIQSALSAANGQEIFFPVGGYNTGSLTIAPNQKIVGENRSATRIKAKDGLNAVLIGSGSSIEVNDVEISNLTIDGNSQNNTSGDTVIINGVKPTIRDVDIIYSAGTGLQLLHVPNIDAYRPAGEEPALDRVNIWNCQHHGLYMTGANDGDFRNIMVADCGIAEDQTYYGVFLAAPTGNGRFDNLHYYATSTVGPNRANNGVCVQSSGNNFSNCFFEGGFVGLAILGSYNTFTGCHFAAPQGPGCVWLAGTGNIISGIVGVVTNTNFPNYWGINLRSPGNIIDVINAGANQGLCIGAVGNNAIRT